jgi:hypothetical protein
VKCFEHSTLFIPQTIRGDERKTSNVNTLVTSAPEASKMQGWSTETKIKRESCRAFHQMT